MVNEGQGLAIIHAARGTGNRLRLRHSAARLPRPLLKKKALVVLPFRGLDLKTHPAGSGVELGEDFFVLFGGQQVPGLVGAGRNKEENIPQNDVQSR